MAGQDFNVAKYSLDRCIGSVEDGISMTKQMSMMATTPEQLEQAKTYLEMIVKKAEYDLAQIHVEEKQKVNVR